MRRQALADVRNLGNFASLTLPAGMKAADGPYGHLAQQSGKADWPEAQLLPAGRDTNGVVARQCHKVSPMARAWGKAKKREGRIFYSQVNSSVGAVVCCAFSSLRRQYTAARCLTERRFSAPTGRSSFPITCTRFACQPFSVRPRNALHASNPAERG